MNRAEWNAANHAYANACKAHDAAQAVFSTACARFFAIPGIAAKADYAVFGAAQDAKKVADVAFDEAYNIASELPQESELEDFEVDDQMTILFI